MSHQGRRNASRVRRAYADKRVRTRVSGAAGARTAFPVSQEAAPDVPFPAARGGRHRRTGRRGPARRPRARRVGGGARGGRAAHPDGRGRRPDR
ncbi:Exonuclease SbcC [Actinacidiphila cocklensis]|uniref:Exonuclease SbcC n=1 Tax=Actinacidiphila cocklensis TaxID=887465 RepID=A0A9W4DZ38_9ACTN|nr:Exonuclease SbcC [Actinacidiphila cocklensis]